MNKRLFALYLAESLSHEYHVLTDTKTTSLLPHSGAAVATQLNALLFHFQMISGLLYKRDLLASTHFI